MDVLIKGTEPEWVEKLLAQIKEEDPEINEDYDDTALRRMIRRAIRKAESYDFTAAPQQSAFVSIMFSIAPNFDDQPEIKAVLEERNLSPKLRLERLWSPLVSEEVWEKAADDHNEDAWNDDVKSAS